MNSPRNQIIELIEQGSIPKEKIGDALSAAKVLPDGKAWRTFIDHLLLWIGGLALAFSVLFFVAYNWHDLGKFAKFGMVEGCMVMAIFAYWKLGGHTVAGQVSLLTATLLLGVLLALYGQTYQTGADPWQLFFNWALMMLPWALIGRFPVLWIIWITLLNLSLVLYHQTFRGVFGFMFGNETELFWLLFFLNTIGLIVWEWLARTLDWLAERWAVRLLAIAGGVPITLLVLHAIFKYRDAGAGSGLVWVIWLAALMVIYRKIRPDLFMLAGSCLSGIVVVVSFLSKHLLSHSSSGGFLFLALLVIGLGTGAAIWLKHVHQEWQS